MTFVFLPFSRKHGASWELHRVPRSIGGIQVSLIDWWWWWWFHRVPCNGWIQVSLIDWWMISHLYICLFVCSWPINKKTLLPSLNPSKPYIVWQMISQLYICLFVCCWPIIKKILLPSLRTQPVSSILYKCITCFQTQFKVCICMCSSVARLWACCCKMWEGSLPQCTDKPDLWVVAITDCHVSILDLSRILYI